MYKRQLYESLDVIEKILKENPGVVVIVDEAYIDFAGKPSAVSLVDRYENLLVTQTFSKSRSMAGVRIGFAIGNERLIRWLLDVKMCIRDRYSVNPSEFLEEDSLSLHYRHGGQGTDVAKSKNCASV